MLCDNRYGDNDLLEGGIHGRSGNGGSGSGGNGNGILNELSDIKTRKLDKVLLEKFFDN